MHDKCPPILTGERTIKRKRTGDFLLIAAGYAAATLAAWLTVTMTDAHPILEVFLAGFVSTLVIFGFSVAFSNSSFYDAYWSVAPPLIALYFAVIAIDAEPFRQVLFPTLMILLGCIPLYAGLSAGSASIGWLDGLACTIGLTAIWLEYRADRELHRFRAQRTSRQAVLDQGVWAWCRHPNYLGEIGFWLSLFLFGVSAWESVYPWSWLGPVSMIGLFVGISIPMIERKLIADKPEYADYRSRVKMLIPGIL